MNKLLTNAIVIAALTGCLCTREPTVSGGTTSTDNARVSGYVVAYSDSVTITICADDYSPVNRSGFIRQMVVAANRPFTVSIPGNQICNFIFTTQNDSSGTFVGSRTMVAGDSVTLDTVVCAAQNPMSVKFDQPVNSSDVVSIEGTPFSAPVTVDIDGIATSFFAALPFSLLPALLLNDTIRLLETTIVADTVYVGGIKSGPLRRISMLFDVEKAVYDSLGGVGVFEERLKAHLRGIDSIFNADPDIAGRYAFAADSINCFTDAPSNHLHSAPAPFRYRMIYSVNDPKSGLSRSTAATDAGQGIDYLMFYSTGYNHLARKKQLRLAKVLAEGRGALDYEQLRVLPENDSLLGIGVTPLPGLLFQPESSQVFDAYSIHLINANGAKMSNEECVAALSLPDSIRITIVDSIGNSVSGAAISLYPVSAVTDTPAISAVPAKVYTTDGAGAVYLTGNYFDTTGDNVIDIVSYLLQIQKSSRTASQWLLIRDVGLAWFRGSKSCYDLTVKLPDTSPDD